MNMSLNLILEEIKLLELQCSDSGQRTQLVNIKNEFLAFLSDVNRLLGNLKTKIEAFEAYQGLSFGGKEFTGIQIINSSLTVINQFKQRDRKPIMSQITTRVQFGFLDYTLDD